MIALNRETIRNRVADSKTIFLRGVKLYEHGAFCCIDAQPEKGSFVYEVDGNYGDYTTKVDLCNGTGSSCDCPYPGPGCKHIVAVMLDAVDRMNQWKKSGPDLSKPAFGGEDLLTPDEIKAQALEDRRNRAKNESFIVKPGDMFKGEHVIERGDGHQYVVTLHDPAGGRGHCSCPDFLTNRLGTCKHIIHLTDHLHKKKGFSGKIGRERFPFIDIFWDSAKSLPRCFCEDPAKEEETLQASIRRNFDGDGLFTGSDLGEFLDFMTEQTGNKRVRIRESVLSRVTDHFARQELEGLADTPIAPPPGIKAELYPYQMEGVRFALYKKAALIGDEMGLGKTLQAIVAALLKKEAFDFRKVLIVTLSSLKEQWQREIHRFTDEKAVIVSGPFKTRKRLYLENDSLFKITNYEAVLRDGGSIAACKPDLIILDEAQRIKNFETKTAAAVKALPRRHALVLTGTPLENKLEDVYSIIQFLEPEMLSPLWQFAADHFMLSRTKKGKIMGYHNLDRLHERLKTIALRRRKQEVLTELPAEVVNNYFIDLDERQAKIHAGYVQSLLPLLDKKFLTPMDLRQIQVLLLKMRQVCDSTYLIDRKTHISPKLTELKGILEELVIQNGHKAVIFSEWTTMNFLIGKQLSEAGIPFVELSGKIPVSKRQALIDEFTNNPACKVFLSSDAGGTGLNLQAADCVINFELPWNPAKLNQRIGRVNRIGQKSTCINVVNLIAKLSIEEKILTGIQLKTDLFKGVFDGEGDKVEFSREKRTELLNRLRDMMGEDREPVASEPVPSEEIPEDTPHFLNPSVLAEEIDYAGEEHEPAEIAASVDDEETSTPATKTAEHSPERMEEVLNQGMAFISGLLEIATGRKIETTGGDDRLIRLDRQTGEVTMKFKLPGF
jgi:superfamily II DNA or RNA helicase/predicted nucleic acid-binding Zn finger protein